MATGKPVRSRTVLTLSTDRTPTYHIEIDGARHPIRPTQTLTLPEYLGLKRSVEDLQTLADTKGALTKTQAQQFIALLKRVTRWILEAPDDVHAKLTDLQRLEICMAVSATRLSADAADKLTPAARRPRKARRA